MRYIYRLDHFLYNVQKNYMDKTHRAIQFHYYYTNSPIPLCMKNEFLVTNHLIFFHYHLLLIFQSKILAMRTWIIHYIKEYRDHLFYRGQNVIEILALHELQISIYIWSMLLNINVSFNGQMFLILNLPMLQLHLYCNLYLHFIIKMYLKMDDSHQIILPISLYTKV